MSSDVIISEKPTRTYTVPSSLTERFGSRATLDDVYTAFHSDDDTARLWAGRILNGIENERSKQEESVLASIDFDPDKYLYCGFTASGDEDLIIAVGRLSRDDLTIGEAEILSQNANWSRIPDAISRNKSQSGVALDPSLLAFTASAFIEGSVAVQLAYGDPHCFLEETSFTSDPILASAKDAESAGHVYAIVDAVDTTAVMDVINIRRGPQVYRRDGGSWVLDNSTLDALLSVNPPPLVELKGSTLSSVLKQVDGNQANQLAPNEDGSAEAGANLEDETKPIETDPKKAIDTATAGPADSSSKEALPAPKPSDSPSADTYKSNQNKSQIKDGSTAQTAALLARYDEINTILASARSLSSDIVNVSGVEQAAKATIARDIVALREDLELREAQIENIILPLLADAVSVYNSTPNQLKARHLRKYWVRGKGAVKIAWGAPGDFRRCVRQLRKYLGKRAEGYCAKRHKEVVGFWPGDKRNTGPKKGAVSKKKLNTN